MNDSPLVSVIIPTYNHGHFIGRCLRSVVSQTFKHWEAIVVNNYSDDNTVDAVRELKDPRINLINFRNNGIIAASRNEGILHSRGKCIAFLDSDDWWHPMKLEFAMKYLGDADVVFHDLVICTPRGRMTVKRIRGRRLRKPVFVDLMSTGNALANSTVVARRDVIERVGGVSEDESLVGVEDFDLWLRISRVTDRFHYIPKSLGSYWMGNENVSIISEKGIAKIESVYARHMEYLTGELRQHAEAFKNYQMGRMMQKLGLCDEAVRCYKVAIRTKSVEYKLKTICCILNLLFNRSLATKWTS